MAIRRWSLMVLFATTSMSLAPATARAAKPHWERRIDAIVAGHPTSVAIGNAGRVWYRHRATVARPPASNEKLLLSMALLDRLGPAHTFSTRAMGSRIRADGSVPGDVYLRGQGDPEVADPRLRTIVKRLWQAGVRSIGGGVVGVTGPFRRDWFAPGWKSYFPRDYIALPTALTYRGNTDAAGRHVTDPERRAAVSLSQALRDRGITVARRATAGTGGAHLDTIAAARSKPLRTVVLHMDRRSINFSAEVLGKALAHAAGDDATIAKGAERICGLEAARAIAATCHDSSGLSYKNRQTAIGIVRMLWWATRRPWIGALRTALPHANQGTLRHRLRGIKVRAKTGTLIDISALSGWVWSGAVDGWVAFSILSSGMSTSIAKDVEDKIVGVLAARAHP
jgi:serine-type D-Ala-D-Ala carboxypeptidase/endopeptidase (penicillin-binding protein 4)